MPVDCGYTPVGIEEEESVPALSVFPDPACDHVIISTGIQSDAQVLTILNAFGQIVYSASDVRGERIEIDTSEWAPGVFSVIVSSPLQVSSTRFILVH